MLPKSWKPGSAVDLIRVGPPCDGGYVIPRILLEKTKILFGLGVSDNWEFEQDFKRRSGCDVVCYDHTVTTKFWRRRFKKDFAAFLLLRRLTPRKIADMFKYISYRRFFNGKNATHHQLRIGYDTPGAISIDTIMKSYKAKDVFFKIDIEGSEYRVIDQLINYHDSLLGLAIELHDVDIHRDRITSFISRFKGFKLVHIHANNHEEHKDPDGDPLHIEMTFLRSDLIGSGVAIERDYPLAGLDFPNSPRHADFKLSFIQASNKTVKLFSIFLSASPEVSEKSPVILDTGLISVLLLVRPQDMPIHLVPIKTLFIVQSLFSRGHIVAKTRILRALVAINKSRHVPGLLIA